MHPTMLWRLTVLGCVVRAGKLARKLSVRLPESERAQ